MGSLFRIIKKEHISLNNSPYELILDMNGEGRNYTPSLGYSTLFGPGLGDEKWWWYKILKVKALPKCKFFMWLIFNNEFLTW